jgi:hypothetical protein
VTLATTSTVRRRVTFEVPDRARVDEVLAAVLPVLSEHAIVDGYSGTGQVIVLRVTFGTAAEVGPLTTAAHNAAMRVTPCDYTVSTR